MFPLKYLTAGVQMTIENFSYSRSKFTNIIRKKKIQYNYNSIKNNAANFMQPIN
jgi:hypothetical protein